MTYKNKSINIGDLVCFSWDKMNKVGLVLSPQLSAASHIERVAVLWDDKSITKEWISDLKIAE